MKDYKKVDSTAHSMAATTATHSADCSVPTTAATTEHCSADSTACCLAAVRVERMVQMKVPSKDNHLADPMDYSMAYYLEYPMAACLVLPRVDSTAQLSAAS